ncbi:MAG: phosphonoacetaldehyde hydrolase [Chromatiaceae bacterium]|nr:MAG: phosphonoacetaldehyde hydrolase [Chromatiaceae bacterium]
MSDPFAGRPFPRGVLIGAAALIGFVIIAAATVRLTGIGATQFPPAPVAEARELLFIAQGDDSTLVAIPGEAGNTPIAELHTAEDGFVLGVLRTMIRDRKANDLPVDAPYVLALRVDGRLVLLDPLIGREIDVRAFGPTNYAAFVTLLRAGPLETSREATAPAAPTDSGSAAARSGQAPGYAD